MFFLSFIPNFKSQIDSISFIDKDNQQAFYYKASAGDILTFPSCEPYYHSVFNFTGADRYAIRINYVIENNQKDLNKKIFEKSEITNYQIQADWRNNSQRYIPRLPRQIYLKEPPIPIDSSKMKKIFLNKEHMFYDKNE